MQSFLDNIIAQLRAQLPQQYGAPVPVTPAPAVAAPAPVAALPVPVPVTTPAQPDELTQKRQQFLREADSTFGQDYGRKNIASSLLDDAINSILQEQKGSAEQYLERGKARGIYNDVGYNAGRTALGSAAEAGSSRLRSLGSGIIDKYRSDANTVRDKAYGAASGYTLGTNFSLDPYIAEGNEVISRANQNAAGDLRNTLGGTQLFDFSSLNNRAGQAQGAINMRDADVATALRERRRVNGLSRGLGSQGAF